MNHMHNLSFVAACCCVLVPPIISLVNVLEGEHYFKVTSEAQSEIPEDRFDQKEYDLRIVEYKELSNTCREIYKEHLSSLLTLITVGAAILGYAISSRLTRRALICAAAVSLGLCWFALARHINYSRSVRAPMEYRLYDLERELGIKVWRTSRPLMVYMWPPGGERKHAEEIEASFVKRANILRILLVVFLMTSAVSVIFLLVWAAVLPSTQALAKPKTGERCSEASNSV